MKVSVVNNLPTDNSFVKLAGYLLEFPFLSVFLSIHFGHQVAMSLPQKVLLNQDPSPDTH